METIWSHSLESFRTDLSARQPAPAGVAASAVAGALGVGLLIKTLTISRARPDLVENAQHLSDELKRLADDDIAAVRDYIANKNAAQAIEVPLQTARSVVAALDLCVEAADHVKTSVRADLAAATHLLAGSVRAILECVDANAGSRTTERSELEYRTEAQLEATLRKLTHA